MLDPEPAMRRALLIAVSLAVALLAGCDMLGIETPEKILSLIHI